LAGILAGTAGLGVLTACGSTTVTATTSSAASSQNSAVSSQVAGAGTATSQASTGAATSQASSAAATTSASVKAAGTGGNTIQIEYPVVGPQDQVFVQIFDGFTKTGKGKATDVGATVDFDHYAETVALNIASGTAPDIIYSHPNWFSSFAGKGLLTDLGSYIASDKTFNLNDYYQGVLDYTRWFGKLFGLPYYSGPAVFYYNKTLLQKIGAADPNDLEKQGKWDWQAFLDIAKQATVGVGAQKTWGATTLDSTLAWLATWVWLGGGHFYNQDLTQSLLNSTQAIDALQFYVDLQLKYKVVPGSGEDNSGQDGFNKGRIAFVHSGRFQAPGIAQAATGWEPGLAPVPKGPAGRHVRNGPNGWMILSSSKAKDVAWEFLKYASSPAGEAPQLTNHGTCPVNQTVASSKAYIDSLLPWENAAVYDQAAQATQGYRAPVQLGQVQSAFNAVWKDVLSGKTTVTSAMNSFVDQANTVLKSS
jgi:ABC-type glycerol-3-phosphate transport system substrate-binding protein